MSKDGGQVFPSPDGKAYFSYGSEGPGLYQELGCGGLSLRDLFAAAALPACISTCANDTRDDGETHEQLFARKAYLCADAMIKARST